MTTVSLRFDDDTKQQLDEMCSEMGMNLTTFFMIYAKKALRDRKIPFEITAPTAYSCPAEHKSQPTAIGRMNQVQINAELQKGLDSLNSGRVYTADEVDNILHREYGI